MAPINLKLHKLSKDDERVVYMPRESGPFMCAHCEYFKGPSSCAKVEGYIDPEGCCNLYESADEDEPEEDEEGE